VVFVTREVVMKKQGVVIAAVVVIVAVIIGVVVLNRPAQEQQAQDPPSTHKEPIMIGAIIPLTGWAAEFGAHERAAAELAIARATEIYPNRAIELAVEDTSSDVKTAVTVFNKLLSTSRPPQALLVESSGASLALATLVDDRDVLMLSIAANPEVTERCKNAFRNFPTAQEETEAILDYAITIRGLAKIGILYLNNDFGRGFLAPFREETERLQANLTFSESYDSGDKDFRAIVSKLKASDTDAVYVVGYGSAMGLLIKQLREERYEGRVLACSAVIYDDVTSIAGAAIEGVAFADIPYRLTGGDEDAAAFVAGYNEKMGKDPSPLASMVYDGLMIVIAALVQTDGSPHAARAAIIEKGSYHGINGEIRIAPSRDLVYDLVVKEISSGKPVPVVQ
jgi:branched-chain amino acid transport system substrate-binding protein